MNTAILIPIVLFVCVCAVAVTAILANAFSKVACQWREVSLKTRMVDAGYSAAEIERVIAAQPIATDFEESDLPPIRKPLPAKKMAS